MFDSNALALHFLSALPHGSEPPPADLGDLERLLVGATAAARAAWPEITLLPEVFVPYLAKRLPLAVDRLTAIGSLRHADLYLACGCAHGDKGALAAFDRSFIRELDTVFSRMGLAARAIEEVRQVLRHHLLVAEGDQLPRIAEFHGRGDLKSWLRVVAVREAVRWIRRSSVEVPAQDELLERLCTRVNPELGYLKELYREQFRLAFREALAELRPKDRNLLAYRYLDRLDVAEIAVIYGVHRVTVSRWVGDAHAGLRRATRRVLAQRLGVAQEEFDSIWRLIESQVEITLGPVLAEGG